MRTRLAVVILAVCAVSADWASAEPSPERAGGRDQNVIVYIGQASNPASKGIYLARLDLGSGKLSTPELAVEARNANFLAFHPSHRFLYSCSEFTDAEGNKTGGVASYAIEPGTGKLTPLNVQWSGGRGPCHVSVDQTGKNVLVANYGNGSVACLPINDDGSLREPSSVVQHEGKSVNPKRQEGPHAHSINLDAGNRFAFAADLGLDKVLIYALDPAKGSLTPNNPPSAALPPGGGPRHLAWRPDGKFAYVNNEMGNTVSTFAYDAEKGELTPKGAPVPTLPADYAEPGNTTSEIVVHRSGKFLYCSNRGHDSIAIFAITEDGSITPRGHASTQGQTPRNFAIDPSGKFLLAANQRTGTVVVFSIDPDTGALTPTGSTVDVPAPVCIRYLPKGE